MIRFHELMLLVIALLAPFLAFAASVIWGLGGWWMPVMPFAAFFGVSLPLIWLTGWLIDNS